MDSLCKKIPIRDNYKDPDDEELKLKAPPLVVRGCFILELLIAGTAFAISYYISSQSTIVETTVDYELRGSEYKCEVLAPLSDAYQFGDNSEVAQFSEARFNSDDCKEALGSKYYDVCSSTNREDYAISLIAVPSTDEDCFDIPLADGYRFCYGGENEYALLETADDQFPYEASLPPAKYSGVFYFAQRSGDIHVVKTTFTSEDVISDYVTDSSFRNVYTIISNSEELQNDVYMLSPDADSATELFSISESPMAISGITATESYVFSFVRLQERGYVYGYNLQTESEEAIYDFDCGGSVEYTTNDYYRFISSTDDGILFLMCDVTVESNLDAPDYEPYSFYRLDWNTKSKTTYYADLGSVVLVEEGDEDGNSTTKKLDSINQIIAFDDDLKAFVNTGSPYFNLLEIDISSQPSFAPSLVPTLRPTNSSDYASPMPTPPPMNEPPPGGRKLATTTAATTTTATVGAEVGCQYTPDSGNLLISGDSIDCSGAPHLTINPSSTFGPEQHGSNNLISSVAGSSLPHHVRPKPTHEANEPNAAHRGVGVLMEVTQPVVNRGVFDGAYMSLGLDSTLYFNDGISQYYTPSTDSFDQYEGDSLRGDYYYATALEVGYSYGVCNGKVKDYVIDAEIENSFRNECEDINGYYYQDHKYIIVPESCAGQLDDIGTDGMTSVDGCAELSSAVYGDFIEPGCDASVKGVCEIAYDENPPYSCTRELEQDFLTVLGTALANASALWSFWIIIIAISLKKIYPQGVLYRDYKARPASVVPVEVSESDPSTQDSGSTAGGVPPAKAVSAQTMADRNKDFNYHGGHGYDNVTENGRVDDDNHDNDDDDCHRGEDITVVVPCTDANHDAALGYISNDSSDFVEANTVYRYVKHQPAGERNFPGGEKEVQGEDEDEDSEPGVAVFPADNFAITPKF